MCAVQKGDEKILALTYYAQMTNLAEEHSDVYEFSVQISGNNPFGCIPIDQTTEVTVNKDTQTPDTIWCLKEVLHHS